MKNEIFLHRIVRESGDFERISSRAFQISQDEFDREDYQSSTKF